MLTMDIEAAQIVAYTYLMPLICVAGIIGNSMLLTTLKLGSLRESPYIYLATLAIADLVALICVSGICTIRCSHCSPKNTVYASKVYEAYVYLPVSNMAALLVSFTTFMMTVERFIYVRHPMSAHNIISRRKTKFIVGFLTLLSIVLNFPRFFLYDVKESPFFGTKDKTAPSFLTLNCVPPLSQYAVDQDMYCNITDPDRGWITSTDEKCVLNVGKIVKHDLFMKDSIFSYQALNELDNVTYEILDELVNSSDVVWINDSFSYPVQTEFDRIVYNITDVKYISKLLSNFPCKKITNFWSLSGFHISRRDHDHYELTNSKFYNFVDERYFLFVSILYIVPYVGVAILNCYIIRIVRRSAIRRRSKLMERTFSVKSVKMTEQDLLTMTLLCLTGIQLLANVVYTSSISPIAKLLYEGDLSDNSNYQVHVVSSNLFILFQYSSNFLFFAFFNGRFRKEFCKVLLTRISTKFKNATSTLRREREIECHRQIRRKNGQAATRLSTSTVVSLCVDS